jgi:hypothetical protein
MDQPRPTNAGLRAIAKPSISALLWWAARAPACIAQIQLLAPIVALAAATREASWLVRARLRAACCLDRGAAWLMRVVGTPEASVAPQAPQFRAWMRPMQEQQKAGCEKEEAIQC